MKTAIVGLPQVGKTALFTILTGMSRETHMGGAAVQVGVTQVPDHRLAALAKVFEPDKVIPATIEYADMPATSREGLNDPSYLGSLRLADAFAHVLRVFESDMVAHVEGDIDPERDWKNLDLELILNDLVVIEKRLARVEKDMGRIKDPELPREHALLVKAKEFLESERPLREMELEADEEKRLRVFQFLSGKPMLLVLNLGEAEAAELHKIEQEYRERWLSGRKNVEVTAVCGSVEAELTELEPEEAREFLEGYGLTERGIDRLIRATYSLLGLMSFLTAEEKKEVRAWTIPKNTRAAKAAGTIHTDFEKKFIRAETIQWELLIERGGYADARKHGELRLEGKEYIVQDGDVLLIRHG